MKNIRLLLLLGLLILSGCKIKQPPADDPSKNGTIIEPPHDEHPKEPPIIYEELGGIEWRDDDLFALAFLGYSDETDFARYVETGEFSTFMAFHNEIKVVEKVYMDGDEVFLVIPRYFDSEVNITDVNHDVQYEGDGKTAALLKTNLSDLHAESIITVSFNDESVSMSPILDGKDTKLGLPAKGVQDVSLYVTHDFEDFKFNIFVFKGEWEASYTMPNGNENLVRLSFHGLDHSSSDDFHPIEYFNLMADTFYKGTFAFSVKETQREPIDHDSYLLYIEFTEQHDEQPYESYSKFVWQFLDFDTLIMRHVGGDSLFNGEEGIRYTLTRIQP